MLTNTPHLPSFTTIAMENFTQQLENLLQTNLNKISDLLQKEHHFNWDNLMLVLENMDDAIERFWSPLSHLHAVVNSKELRQCYQECLTKLSDYEAAISHNHQLYYAIKSLAPDTLNSIQQKIVNDILRDFELSGVALPTHKQKRFARIQSRLAELANQFDNNVLDATQAFSIHITDEKLLQGLPEHCINTARELALAQNTTGWILNLEFPCYQAVISYADNRSLREEIYYAYVTRASDQGPFAKKFDNNLIINEILNLRHEKAVLLGFNNYAQLSLATKMASSTVQVDTFLNDLSARAYPRAQNEFKELQEFALAHFNIKEIKPWDVAYLSEKKQKYYYAISQEELRPYFPLTKVMAGLFSILEKLFGVYFQEVDHVDLWHPDVKCYLAFDETKQARGYIYVDLFARPHKRNGAWMDSLQSRRKLSDGSTQLPIATLTCNFAKPSLNKAATLSHDEVLTLFHECGHCLHHILTCVDYYSAAGLNGVEWDAVELPSQFLENWCWEEKALALLTQHISTQEALPAHLLEKLIAAKNFQSAMMMMRQLEFACFDIQLHAEYDSNIPHLVEDILARVRKQTSVVPIASYNRFYSSFSHIFSGGYAAGYYSYKWAEVLSCDAFERFVEEGIFNHNTGLDFLHNILEIGSTKNMTEAYRNFRGRDATIDALLRLNGIA